MASPKKSAFLKKFEKALKNEEYDTAEYLIDEREEWLKPGPSKQREECTVARRALTKATANLPNDY